MMQQAPFPQPVGSSYLGGAYGMGTSGYGGVTPNYNSMNMGYGGYGGYGASSMAYGPQQSMMFAPPMQGGSMMAMQTMQGMQGMPMHGGAYGAHAGAYGAAGGAYGMYPNQHGQYYGHRRNRLGCC
eukprot:TRINITY_DN24184_c0_g1_i1.p3 TRINITY_DN24184_c0_g1~~TRINITY_DN24184_c0_g1_i1.p3  ORF type:complete len:126 (-),score=23.56 TRINITY_DN24184_c0_g1_i1:390-767(-)